MSNVRGQWKSGALKDKPIADKPVPFMGPPLLLDGEVAVSQMSACIYYLSCKLNLLPDDPVKASLCMKTLGDCTDVLSEMSLNNGFTMWDEKGWTEFRGGRFVKWLQIFEETGTRQGLGTDTGFFLGTTEASIADMAVFACWGTIKRCFGELLPDMETNAPRVMALCARLGENPGLKKLFEDQEKKWGKLYCGGQIEKSLRKVLG